VLDGVRAVVATAPPAGEIAQALEGRLAALGARVARCELAPGAEPAAEKAEASVAAAAIGELGGADLLVVDGAGLYAAAGAGAPLPASMQAGWELTRAVASEAMIAGEGGLVVLIAPPPGAGEHADAARAGLENLARTLSIEWARFATRTVAVAPGDATSPPELAELVAYLASPGGAYYSGCQLDLRGARP
jgi:NAD(P)-dependent dehydrogenase (short-subunit alcohol dehydrogenase family)